MTVSVVVQACKCPPYRTITGTLTLVPVPCPCSTASYEMFQVEHDGFGRARAVLAGSVDRRDVLGLYRDSCLVASCRSCDIQI